MLIVFICFWALVALVVFFLAMRRPSGPDVAESTLGQRTITMGIVIVFAFGLAVPALVLAFNGEHKASVAVGGVVLNREEQKGRELFAHTCGVCHTLAAVKTVGRIGPNLDTRVGEDISTPAGRIALVENAIAEGRARGLGQMPALLFEGKEAEDVAKFVAAVAGR
ncbi:MAG: c-type cytochrome [Solirubrobacteraceae bacterium]